ncbi:unnamed protein product [Darwinula stevensoni]|uniref:Uncharacterized protein n=1 Tax=Darwinula stevensoni TaxID=69355 RepID=A0A7R9A3U7_9CRUS|nr:unnamed protein product [Darwinula stevensoni]CAG0891305.1 unnamed protein product [Darwinula stevensoni]
MHFQKEVSSRHRHRILAEKVEEDMTECFTDLEGNLQIYDEILYLTRAHLLKVSHAAVVVFLNTLGGFGVMDSTYRVMRHLMTNHLACQVNWIGTYKMAFRSMRVKDLVVSIPDSDTDSNTLQGAVRVEGIWTQAFTAALVVAALVVFLSTLGGFGVMDSTYRVMRHLMTNHLACQVNWIGTYKMAFRNMRVKDLVVRAVAVSSGGKLADVEQSIRKFIKNASDREGGRDFRRRKKMETGAT